ncbi:MAG: hypothetical protein H6815_01215 [Phycisphaeraceae bacterium]|nr:hypothetical protein [Phycisphaerales bacterium]MCB9859046.1 hypothetical protein [Phycisphaeraceae bacterium]
MQLIVIVSLIVVAAGVLIALAWWKFSDAIFPGSRSTEQEPLNPHINATVISKDQLNNTSSDH